MSHSTQSITEAGNILEKVLRLANLLKRKDFYNLLWNHFMGISQKFTTYKETSHSKIESLVNIPTIVIVQW